jgi:hypothetical protein
VLAGNDSAVLGNSGRDSRLRTIGDIVKDIESREAAMRINRRDVFKFLSGAFFVSAGANWYFYWLGVAVPLPFSVFGFTAVSPALLGLRALIHFTLFLVSFYLGFIRK